MQITDPIADLLTRIRNASTAKHPSVDVPASNLKKAICQILVDEGPGQWYSGHRRLEARFQARPAHLHQLRGYAQSHEGPGHRNHLHFQGRYDR